ncbi:MAG: DNA repair protein RecO [Nitrospirota bacterium]|nr:DNA repair protein RecO [Nitrospirota bacterium]
MLHRTEGIVLRTISFGEADLIVTYLTPDFGPVKIFAKSPRKVKSRFGSSLEPLVQSRISFWGKEDASLPKLTQSDIIHSFQTIRDTLNSFLTVSEIIELTLHFIPEREANKEAYSLFLNALYTIENNSNKNLAIIHYKIKFLELTGYIPKLDACGRCGRKGNCFYVAHGTILCETCSAGMVSSARLSPGAVKLHKDLLTWDITKINRIRPSDMLLSELSHIIDMHIHHILTKPLKSREFIHSLSE